VSRVENVTYQSGGHGLTVQTLFQSQVAEISVIFYRKGIVRYQIRKGGIDAATVPLYLAHSLEPDSSFHIVHQREGEVEVATESVRCSLSLSPWKLTLATPEGKEILTEFPEDVNVRGQYLSLPTGFYDSEETGKYRTRINFELDPTASYFGLGEKFLPLNRRGQRIVLWNENPYGSGTEKAYKNIPFLLSNRGFGLFLNHTSRSVWDIGHTSNFSLAIEVEDPHLDLFIITGSSLKEILFQYTALTGRAPLPPRWSFGLWISPYGDYLSEGGNWKAEEFLSFARQVREKNLPSDVIHLDPFWMGKKKGYCDFLWEKEDFSHPESFVGEFLGLGYRLCLWEHPYIEKGTPLYEEGSRNGYFLKKPDGSVYDCNLVIVPPEKRKVKLYSEDFYALGGIVDFTNPEAVEWYKALHRPLIEMGVATFKTDFGEVIPEDAVFFNGKTGREFRNYYPVLYNKTVFEVLQEYDERPVLWGRSGYAGIQRYPVQWSGDPHSNFRSLITTLWGGLSYGMSGVPFWSFDMGGFKGLPTLEAYIRWSQLGLFLSHSRFHGTDARMPWKYGEEASEIIRTYVRRRYALLPYLYATAYEATQTGLPVIRPLCLEFEQDPLSCQVETEYMLGDSILVVPVLNPRGEVTVYLPPGRWYDFDTWEEISGPVVMKKQVPLSKFPMYLREGFLLPTTEPTPTVPDFWEHLSLSLGGSRERILTIPEEGRPNTQIEFFQHDGSRWKLRIEGPSRKYTLKFYRSKPQGPLWINGKPASVSWDKEDQWNTVFIEGTKVELEM